MANWSRTLTFFNGAWHEGNVPIMGARTHGAWQGTSVFDGGRVFDDMAPDLDLHCARVNRSAKTMGLNPTMEAGAIEALAREGARKFGAGAQVYVKPMYWGEGEGPSTIIADPDDVGFCLCLFEAPMPVPGGFSVTSTRYRRPTNDTMPTDAKAGCLYPNNGRAILEAKGRGFDNALVLDMLGNVAETGTSNIFLAKDGHVMTPAPNGTFLSGITRSRTINLLGDYGFKTTEKTLTIRDFLDADEIFSTGNHSKVVPITRIENRDLQPGPVAKKARELYWDWAHSTSAA